MAKKGDRHKNKFEVRTIGELRSLYGFIAENRPALVLNHERVPEELRHLIPFAEFWGVSDDTIREDLATKTPTSVKAELKSILREYDDVLDQWLAGPEADSSSPSPEYVAFSAMRMIADTF
jgi:hypothetical protein